MWGRRPACLRAHFTRRFEDASGGTPDVGRRDARTTRSVHAVTGLAIALDSAVMAAFEARERALARMVLESRLSAVLSDPPLTGSRVIEARDNNGIRVEETMEQFEAKTTNGVPVTGLWKLKVTADWDRRDKSKETAEILLFRP